MTFLDSVISLHKLFSGSGLVKKTVKISLIWHSNYQIIGRISWNWNISCFTL